MKRNFVFTAISIGSRLLTGLLLFVLLARLWGPADFGLFSFVFSFVAIVVLIVDFGFAGYLLREVGARPDDLPGLFRGGMTAKLLLLVPCALTAIALGAMLGDATPLALMLPLFVAGLALSFADYCIAPLRALGRYDVETLVLVVANVLQFGVAAASALLGGGVVQVAWAIVIARLIYLGLAAVALLRVAPGVRHLSGAGEGIRAVFRRILPYGVDGLLTTAWGQLDVVLVRALYGVHTAGVYAAGQKVVQGGVAIAPVLGNVLIPKLSRLFVANHESFESEARKSSFLLVFAGVLLSTPFLLFPAWITQTVFGSGYEELDGFLSAFGLILLVRYAAAGSGVVLTSKGLQGKRVVSQATGLLVFFVMVLGIDFLALKFDFFLVAMLAAGFCVFVVNESFLRRSRGGAPV